MSEDLTNDQIAVLCAVGEDDREHLTHDRKHDLEWLISAGYAEPEESTSGSGFKLTAKAIKFLGKRGVGLNEG